MLSCALAPRYAHRQARGAGQRSRMDFDVYLLSCLQVVMLAIALASSMAPRRVRRFANTYRSKAKGSL